MEEGSEFGPFSEERLDSVGGVVDGEAGFGLTAEIARYQLSRTVETMGFEPTTPCLQSRCSAN